MGDERSGHISGRQLPAARSRKIVVKNYNAGFFANFNLVLSALEWAEKCSLPCQVDWSRNWRSSDFAYGLPGVNVWCQLFDGLDLRDDGAEAESFDLEGGLSGHREMYEQTRRTVLNSIYRRHIRPHRRLFERVEHFQRRASWGGDVLGLHVRHPHHADEQYGEGMPKLDRYWEIVEDNPSSQVFVATDIQDVATQLKADFGSRIICQEDVARARIDGLPVHRNNSCPRLSLAEDVFTDCLLLTRCCRLFGVYSNVTWAACYIAPSLRMVRIAGDGLTAPPASSTKGTVWRVPLVTGLVNCTREGAWRDGDTGCWVLSAKTVLSIQSGDLALVFEERPDGRGRCLALASVAKPVDAGEGRLRWLLEDSTELNLTFEELAEGLASFDRGFELDPLKDRIAPMAEQLIDVVTDRHGSVRLWLARSQTL